jgi:hypothetical protein
MQEGVLGIHPLTTLQIDEALLVMWDMEAMTSAALNTAMAWAFCVFEELHDAAMMTM